MFYSSESNPLKCESVAKLCIRSFEKSGDRWYGQFVKAVDDINNHARKPLDEALEMINIAEADGEFTNGTTTDTFEDSEEALVKQVKFYEDKMPTCEEATLWLLNEISPFARPKRRGRGTTNWEKIQVLKSDPFKVALLKLTRVVNSVEWAKQECETRAEKGEPEVEHFVDTSIGWQARADSFDDCEEPDDWMPGSEELRTWLEQLEGLELLANLEPFVPLEEYS